MIFRCELPSKDSDTLQVRCWKAIGVLKEDRYGSAYIPDIGIAESQTS